MAKTLQFKLITPEKVAFELEADHITVPTTSGEITILPGHIALVSQLGSGELVVSRGSESHSFAVTGGFISINGEVVEALAEAASHADDIDLQKAEEAKARAEKLRETTIGEQEVAEVSAALAHALAQIKVANHKRRRHN